MAEILKGAMLVEFHPPRVEQADLCIEGNRITARADGLIPQPGDTVTELEGRLIMPGLVLGHTHLSRSLARGMPAPRKAPRNVTEALREVWWKLDQALDEESIGQAAQVGATEALLAGVTTIIDHHSSPNFVDGSLDAVRRGIDAVGLRSVLSYEISDRHGADGSQVGLVETERFLRDGRTGRSQAMVGGQSLMTLEPGTLDAMAELTRRFNSGVHLHVAESPDDERDCRERFDLGLIDRLAQHELLGPKTLLAHCTHLGWEELSQAQTTGAWLLHCPRANMQSGAGYAPAGKFGARKALGTDGLDADVLAEARAAHLRGRDAGLELEVLRWLAGGHLLAGELFGERIGMLEAGALADLVVLDYPASTPLTAGNLEGHVTTSLGAPNVDAVMVDGLWRLWARQVLSFDQAELHAKARETARSLWSRVQEL